VKEHFVAICQSASHIVSRIVSHRRLDKSIDVDDHPQLLLPIDSDKTSSPVMRIFTSSP
jgi:hypothetical protein